MQHHVIFTNGRSGSNFLVDALNQHPHVCNYGEVLGSYMPSMKLHRWFRYGGWTVESYLDFVSESRVHFELAQRYSKRARRRRGDVERDKPWHNIRTLGFKDLGIRFSQHDLDDYLLRRPDVQVINLYRANILRRAISLLALTETGQVLQRKGDPSNRPRFHADPDDVLSLMAIMERETERQMILIDQLEPERVYTLSYEDFFASPEATRRHLRQMFELLGVAPIHIMTRHERVLSPDLRQTVSNFDELAQAIGATRYEMFLHDDAHGQGVGADGQAVLDLTAGDDSGGSSPVIDLRSSRHQRPEHDRYGDQR